MEGKFVKNSNQVTGTLVQGDVNGNVVAHIAHPQATQHINLAEPKKTLVEAATEIQELLKKLEENNPTATEPEQVAYINIATKSDLKKRAIAALKEGGDTAIDEFILENKYLKVVKAVVKGWLQSSN
ncbi:MAG: hypothetical protein V7K94_21980 [Nostoc sp.]|uniref:hypothetical protein n=1 Tax=Nostoc sp. TaxID=1180 RepID=UPI002FF778DD